MKILILSTHPDDETLGCGGAILRHIEAGDEVHWGIMTQGHEPQWSKSKIERKAEEVNQVANAYGMASVEKLGFPTIKLDEQPLGTVIDGIRSLAERIRPETVYLVHEGDVHTDHSITFRAAMSVFKAFYMHKLGIKRILSYETLSSTEAAPPHSTRAFIPTVYKDITPFIEKKLEIMNLYASETQVDPMPRGPSAIRALARYRGATIGVEFAEAFVLIREIEI